jgi:hypothetical protein
MPTEQEIADYLTALNRTQKAWVHNKTSEAAKERGIRNLRHWFQSNNIKLRQQKDENWEIVPKEEDATKSE